MLVCIQSFITWKLCGNPWAPKPWGTCDYEFIEALHVKESCRPLNPCQFCNDLEEALRHCREGLELGLLGVRLYRREALAPP